MPLDLISSIAFPGLPGASEPLVLHVRMPDGGWISPPAESGAHVLDLIARFGVPVRSRCGGSGSSCDCHVHIGSKWRDRLPAPSASEAARLAAVDEVAGPSRLLCELVMTSELDGLEIELGWDALEPQPYWIAG